jgi:hypothetical protein
MAKYLEEHVLDVSGDLIKATWCSGLGTTPLGFTSYAPNSIEVSHRILEAMMGNGMRYQDICSLMTKVCGKIETRIDEGKYDSLVQEHPDTWPWLLQHDDVKWSSRSDTAEEFDGARNGKQLRRLDAKFITAHYRKEGAERTFIVVECDRILSTGQRAIKLYVMPKYQLKYAVDKRDDMNAMVALGLQNSVEDVRRAATQSDEYSFWKHMFLRRTFVTIYLTDSGKAVDCHKHYIEACGHSEHAWFIETLQKPDGLANIASGPKNSKPQPKKPKAKSKRSEALSAMLRSPSSRGGNRQAAHAEPAGGVVLAMPDKGRPIEPSMEASEMESDSVDSTRCVARTFFGGLGT